MCGFTSELILLNFLFYLNIKITSIRATSFVYFQHCICKKDGKMSKLKYPSMKSLQNGEIHTLIFLRVKAVTQLFIIVYKNNTDWHF